jgi:hypothetical protein
MPKVDFSVNRLAPVEGSGSCVSHVKPLRRGNKTRDTTRFETVSSQYLNMALGTGWGTSTCTWEHNGDGIDVLLSLLAVIDTIGSHRQRRRAC